MPKYAPTPWLAGPWRHYSVDRRAKPSYRKLTHAVAHVRSIAESHRAQFPSVHPQNMPLQNLSDLELRILARIREQNLNLYDHAPNRDVSTDDGSESDNPGLEKPPSPQAGRLGNIDW